MKLLVLISHPITAAQLRAAVGAEVDPADTELLVLAPAFTDSAIKFWLSDTDEAIERATQVRSQTVRELAGEGVPAAGRTGASDPVQAIDDALKTFSADRILLFTDGADAHLYREDIDEDELVERFGLPVEHASAA